MKPFKFILESFSNEPGTVKPLKFILESFSNEPGGASARKLTAFAFMLCIAWIHLNYVNHENAIAALIIDVSAALLSLSIITAENLIRLRHGGKGGSE